MTLAVRGLNEVQFGVGELSARPDVVELGALDASRAGTAVRLSALLEAVSLPEHPTMLKLVSTDGYAASLPFEAASRVGLIWFASPAGPLTAEQGGPFRFLIPNAAECHTAALDKCANVKGVVEITVE